MNSWLYVEISTMEQRAMCLRYYDGADLREDFIGFAECKSTTEVNWFVVCFLNKHILLTIEI